MKQLWSKIKTKAKEVKGKKVKILAGAGLSAAVIGTTIYITKKWDYEHLDRLLEPNEIMCGVKKPVDIPFDKSKCTAGDLVELWEEKGIVNMIIENADLDKLSDFTCDLQNEIGGLDRFDVIIGASKS